MKHVYKLLALAAFVLACVASTAPHATVLTASFIGIAAILFTGIGIVQSLRGRMIDNTNAVFLENTPIKPKSGTFILDFAIADGTQLVIVKVGSDAEHVALPVLTGSVWDKPFGIIYNESGQAAAIGDKVTVHYLKGGQLMFAIAAGALAQNTSLFLTTNGQVTGEPVTAGVTSWKLGNLENVTGAAGDVAVFAAMVPEMWNVIAKLSCIGATAGTDDTTTEALLALAVADLTAISVASAHGARVKMLQS